MPIEIREEVRLIVDVKCPKCLRRMAVNRKLPGEALRTGNTTQMAQFHLAEMRGMLEAEMRKRRWDRESCGRCADPEEPEPGTLGADKAADLEGRIL